MKYFFILFVAFASAASAFAQSPTQFVANTQVTGTTFERRVSETRHQVIHYYLAPNPSGPRPLLLVLQGSGCEPVFKRDSNGISATAGQDIIQQMAAGRFTVMIVDKPEVVSESGARDGTTDACSPAFNSAHSLDAWTQALSRAVNDALRDPSVSRRTGVRVLGLSEGAVVAARLAAQRRDVNHVVFISGFGCGQWRDMLVTARRSASDNAAASVAATENAFRDIAAHPNASDRQFEGQTYLFWSTFGRACPAHDLLTSNAHVFVAYGTADEQIDANGVEAITAAFLEVGRPIDVRRVIGGSHVLDTPGSAPFANLLGVFHDALDWLAE